MAETTVLRASAINRTPNAGAKPQAQLSGALPVVSVNMNSGGPQISGGQGTVRQGVTLLPPKGAKRDFTTGGLPNQPAKQSVTVFPPKGQLGASAPSAPALTADQLLLCRHLADKYLGDLRAAAGETPTEETPDNVKLAEGTVAAIDASMAALTAAAAAAAATPVAPPRTVAAGVRSSQNAASAAPRRVSRPAPVSVTMDSGRPIVQTGPDLPNHADPIEIASDAQS